MWLWSGEGKVYTWRSVSLSIVCLSSSLTVPPREVILNMYVFTQPLHRGRDSTKGQLFKRRATGFKTSFRSFGPIAAPRLKKNLSVSIFTRSWGRDWFMPFLRAIVWKWNATIFVPQLNSGHYVNFDNIRSDTSIGLIHIGVSSSYYE